VKKPKQLKNKRRKTKTKERPHKCQLEYSAIHSSVHQSVWVCNKSDCEIVVIEHEDCVL